MAQRQRVRSTRVYLVSSSTTNDTVTIFTVPKAWRTHFSRRTRYYTRHDLGFSQRITFNRSLLYPLLNMEHAKPTATASAISC